MVNTGIGQNATTIGEGNETLNGGMLPINMSGDYQYSWTQQIVLQSELGAAHYIGSLEFPSNDWMSFSFNKVRVYVGHTDKTSFSGTDDYVPVNDLTLVYMGIDPEVYYSGIAESGRGETPRGSAYSGYINNGYGFHIDFDSHFAYNGTSNLIVAIAYEASVSSGMVVGPGVEGKSGEEGPFLTHETTDCMALSFADSNEISLSTPSATEAECLNYRNNFEISFSEGVPYNLYATCITNTSAKVRWMMDGSVSGYVVEVDGDEWRIATDYAGATLQVVDLLGRVLKSEEAKSSFSTAGMAPGVYVFRLINGDAIRSQKVVLE